MCNRCAVRTFGLCSVDVYVNPLVVTCDIGELVDALLVDLVPLADPELLADQTK